MLCFFPCFGLWNKNMNKKIKKQEEKDFYLFSFVQIIFLFLLESKNNFSLSFICP
jgi:hypothetical protein